MTLYCSQCTKRIERKKSHVDAKKRLGQSNFYCSQVCSRKSNRGWNQRGFYF